MEKNSFTLFETLISITFLLIVITGFKYSSYYDEKDAVNFMLLNDLENSFDNKNYENFSKSSQNIQIIKNRVENENLTLFKYQFENENIKLFKYEK